MFGFTAEEFFEAEEEAREDVRVSFAQHAAAAPHADRGAACRRRHATGEPPAGSERE